MGVAEIPVGFIKFWRAWYYWVAGGLVPLDVAKRLYAHPEGKKNVRVAGHCGCPPPEKPWIHWYNIKTGKEMMDQKDYEAQLEKYKDVKEGDAIWNVLYVDMPKKYEIVDNIETDPKAQQFIDCYHIDSQAGLLLFAQEITKLNER